MRQTVGIALIVIAIFIQVMTRLLNIDVTETRLLIDFWWVWLIGVILTLIGAWMMLNKKESYHDK